jgi:hypothetical protein
MSLPWSPHRVRANIGKRPMHDFANAASDWGRLLVTNLEILSGAMMERVDRMARRTP